MTHKCLSIIYSRVRNRRRAGNKRKGLEDLAKRKKHWALNKRRAWKIRKPFQIRGVFRIVER